VHSICFSNWVRLSFSVKSLSHVSFIRDIKLSLVILRVSFGFYQVFDASFFFLGGSSWSVFVVPWLIAIGDKDPELVIIFMKQNQLPGSQLTCNWADKICPKWCRVHNTLGSIIYFPILYLWFYIMELVCVWGHISY